MITERKHGIGTGQNPLMSAMDTVKKSDCQFHTVRWERFAEVSG